MPVLQPASDPIVRFDDADRDRTLHFAGCRAVFRADDLAEVRPAIEWASARAGSGDWVAGFVAYGAAPAFDPSLRVLGGAPGPLAWFAAFETADGHPWDDVGAHAVSRWTPLLDETTHRRALAAVREAIEAGDTYQVNVTFPLGASFSGDPRSLYQQLLASQAVSYAAYLDVGDRQIVSGSPERFFAVDDRRIVTRPMKGTRPRGRWLREDRERRGELEASEKDRAENLMIVDLIRNDLGRVAEIGTVAPTQLFAVEAYRTVWQMTSEITADLRPDVGLVEVFDALFPCGSVTGAPKASTMDVIARVEPWARGVYCGSIGFIPPGDGLDGATFNVAIRTAVVDPHEGVASYGIGGGITWDSDPGLEWDEALTKGAALAPVRPVDGLFETLRWDGDWVLLDEHLDRLAWSSDLVDIPFDRRVAMDVLEDAVAGVDGPTRVRITVDRDGGMSIRLDDAPSRFALGPGPSADAVALDVDLDPVDPSDPSLYLKTTDRSRYDSRRRRHPDADDVLLTNTLGNVTESTIANIAVLIDGHWVTPPVGEGLLPGLLRGRLVDDGVLVERPVSIGELRGAEGIALINSVRGWRPALLMSRSPARTLGSG